VFQLKEFKVFNEGIFTPLDPNVTLAEAFEQYRARVSILKKGYAQEVYRIRQISRSFLGAMKPREITSVEAAKYRDLRLQTVNAKTKRLLSNATVRLELALLSSFFDIAKIEWGICDDNPISKIRKPKIPPGRDRRLTAREERQILRYAYKHVNPELYSIVVVALETAKRQGEILNLHWEHLNLRTRIAHLPETKNGTKRDVPLSVKARDALIRLGVKNKGKVFGYTAHGLKSTWRFMLKKLGIEDLHFHDLRHESISRLFELGSLDMMEVAAISGHKSLAMLKRYTHLKAQRLVRKLEGNRNRGKQYLFDHLIPYPAELIEEKDHVAVRLLDFRNAVPIRAADRETAIALAQDLLMRVIVTSLKDSRPLPPPDQYLDLVPEEAIVMIDPVPSTENPEGIEA